MAAAAAPQRRSRGWCFTKHEPWVGAPKWDSNLLTYLVYQEEETKQGGRHLQGYCHFSAARTMAGVKLFFGWDDMHLEVARGTPAEAAAYCKKEESRVAGGQAGEYGELPVQGKRNDIVGAKRALEEGGSARALRASDEHAAAVAKYPGYFDRREADIREEAQVKRLKERADAFVLRPWQRELLGLLAGEPDDRTVIWVEDKEGGAGKTWFAKFLFANQGARLFAAGKLADLAFAWAQRQSKIVVIDIPRSASQGLIDDCYAFAEGVKDGDIFSAKYESKCVISDPAHVVMFSNSPPDRDRLSADRWRHFKINDGALVAQLRLRVVVAEGSEEDPIVVE